MDEIVRITTGAPAGHLWLGLLALSKLPSRFLQCDERDPRPLRYQAQVRITAKRALMADLAEEVAHVEMVLEIPRRQVRLATAGSESAQGVGLGASARSRIDRNAAGSPLPPAAANR